MKRIPIIALIIVCIIQWIIPGKIIRAKENILSHGKVFRFRTEPIDPTNPFVGKYIRLRFKEDEFPMPASENQLDQRSEIFVMLQSDKDGYAKISGIVTEQPAAGVDFVKARVGYTSYEKDNSYTIHIIYPFEQFYMDEYKAPKAETQYRKSNMDSTQRIYAAVSVLKGDAVIRDVMINDKPIVEVINEANR
jgi:uncharacterized membrane-anchored protein